MAIALDPTGIASLGPQTSTRRHVSPGGRIWRRFKSQRIGYLSLIVFLSLYAFSLAGELFFNDRPLVVYYEGHTYFPLFRTYPESTFGGDLPIAADYNDPFIRDRLERPGVTAQRS